MTTKRIVFSEVTTYEAEIEVPEGVDISDHWFDLLESQNPEWFKGERCKISVSVRELDDIEPLSE